MSQRRNQERNKKKFQKLNENEITAQQNFWDMGRMENLLMREIYSSKGQHLNTGESTDK